MTDEPNNGGQRNARLWEMQSVLQRAAAGDYSARVGVSMARASGSDPLSMIAPSVNMLIAEVENRGIELAERQLELESSERSLAEQRGELEAKLRLIEDQREAIRELSTPVLELWDDVLVLPVVGTVDTRRANELMTRLLDEIAARQTLYVILDITGIDILDTRTADHFIKVVQAAALLGTRCIITGISPAVAQTLVALSVDLSQISTVGSLKDGLKECLRRTGT